MSMAMAMEEIIVINILLHFNIINSLYVVVVDVCTEEIASIEPSFYTTLVHSS
jgi:hypothetical protein